MSTNESEMTAEKAYAIWRGGLSPMPRHWEDLSVQERASYFCVFELAMQQSAKAQGFREGVEASWKAATDAFDDFPLDEEYEEAAIEAIRSLTQTAEEG